MAKFTKLNDGTWGVRVDGAAPAVGSTVTVTKRDGSTQAVVVAKVLWHGAAKDGVEASLVAIVSDRPARAGATYERGVGLVCDECGERAVRGTRCWETGMRH